MYICIYIRYTITLEMKALVTILSLNPSTELFFLRQKRPLYSLDCIALESEPFICSVNKTKNKI